MEKLIMDSSFINAKNVDLGLFGAAICQTEGFSAMSLIL